MIERINKKLIAHSLAIFGCAATGILYVAIGVIAILSFLRLKDGGADESSLLVFLNDYLIGKFLIWIILLGTTSYIIWRIYESFSDPYDYGKQIRGIAKRTGIALSTIADALIVYSAIQALLGTGEIPPDGEPEAQRQMAANILSESWGQMFLISLGAITVAVSVVQFIYGITRGYRERLDIGHFSSTMKSLIHILAWVGYFSRGIIIGIIGFFYLKAGILENGDYVVNTDKAFDFIGDHVGHLYFIIVAIGTVCYGFFMFTLGYTYDSD